jgi:hypothetical protein
MPLGCDHLLLRYRHRVKERLHRRFAEATINGKGIGNVGPN